VQAVCDTYLEAPQRRTEHGTHTISTDEMTSIQALERIAPTKPTAAGQVERREFEYARHGTQCLIANLDVVTGEVVSPTVQATRTEVDFVDHVARTVAVDPEVEWIVVCDQLNIHWSEGLVRYVAQQCQLPDELGKKGRRGVLKSKATRKAFLEDKSHRIRFVYTPRHTSWLNQIEIWFSILMRRVLRRGSFRSTTDLRDRLLAFIDYFNRTLAKPFKWTYTGRPLNL
jgi:DDE superfamily endonuclease